MKRLACIIAATLASAASAEIRTEIIPLNYADARDVAAVLEALFPNEVNASAFPQTNALLVNLSPSGAAAAQVAPPNGRRPGATPYAPPAPPPAYVRRGNVWTRTAPQNGASRPAPPPRNPETTRP